MNSKLDLEVFLIGQAKLEFLNMLSDVYKSNFVETFSWGHFRRFQLSVSQGSSWLNIFFVMLKNDANLDLILNRFKQVDKKNPLIIIYNINDQKSDKEADELISLYKEKKEKIYKGILNSEIVKANSEKIKAFSKVNRKDNISSKNEDFSTIDESKLKDRLNFLEEDGQLLIKVGFVPNTVNKKTKMIKKNDNNSAYDIEDQIFYVKNEGEALDGITFVDLMEGLVFNYFDRFYLERRTLFVDLLRKRKDNKLQSDSEAKESNSILDKSKKKYIDFLINSFDLFVVLLLAFCIYRFIYDFS